MKAGDKIFIYVSIENETWIEKREIHGFNSLGIYFTETYADKKRADAGRSHLPSGYWHFCRGLFYSFGYHKNGYLIYTTKKWHILFAYIVEKIRLEIPEKWAKRLNLER